jgi:hypothetical protein
MKLDQEQRNSKTPGQVRVTWGHRGTLCDSCRDLPSMTTKGTDINKRKQANKSCGSKYGPELS